MLDVEAALRCMGRTNQCSAEEQGRPHGLSCGDGDSAGLDSHGRWAIWVVLAASPTGRARAVLHPFMVCAMTIPIETSAAYLAGVLQVNAAIPLLLELESRGAISPFSCISSLFLRIVGERDHSTLDLDEWDRVKSIFDDACKEPSLKFCCRF